MRRLSLALVTLCLAPALAQDVQPVREVLQGENATVVFSPNGGYAPQNYLKRYTTQAGEQVWATQEGAVAEMILRCSPGGKVRVGTFRMSDASEVVDACFRVAREKNVEVKLWLKGPPGLEYMVPGHEAIASRANEYLRERAQQGMQDAWGDVQVMIGTRAQMSAFGKVNDMHEKFGLIDARNDHQPGTNHAFMGTSNLSSSSDLYHNEHRIIFHSNPQATQALWTEFARLWEHLGECRTYVDGDPAKGPNATPEDPRVRLPGGGFADEGPDDVLQFRFTYEKRNGSFHRISRDFIDALRQADQLPAGAVVWIAQFGFQIGSITDALIDAARDNPDVDFRVMVMTKEGEGWSVRQVVNADLPNLQVRVKWDSNKLILNKGQRPQLPDHDTGNMPSLLHHKSLVLGDRLMITGSFNFFGDADSQGENVVIVRNHLDTSYAHLLNDAQAEFQAIWDAQVMFDARQIHGSDGLLSVIRERSGEDGFLETLRAASSVARSVAEIHERVSSQAGLDAVTEARVAEWLEVLERFEFVERDPQQRYLRSDDNDVLAHAAKPQVRAEAKQPEPEPETGPWTGLLERAADRLELAVAGQRYPLQGELTASLDDLVGHQVTLSGTVDEAGELVAEALVAPQAVWVEGLVEGETFTPTGGDALAVQGPAAGVVRRAEPDQRIGVRGYRFAEALVALSVRGYPNRVAQVTYKWVPVGELDPAETVEILRHTGAGYTKIRMADGAEGYTKTSYVDLTRQVAGASQALPGGGQ